MRYEFRRVSEKVIRDMEELNVINVEWLSDRKRKKTDNSHFHLHSELGRVHYRKLNTNSFATNEHRGERVLGFTKSVMIVRPTSSTKMRTRTHLSSGGKDSRQSYETP